MPFETELFERGESPLPALPPYLDRLPGVAWTVDRHMVVREVAGQGFGAGGIDAAAWIGRTLDELAFPASLLVAHREILGGSDASTSVRATYGGRTFDFTIEPICVVAGVVARAIALGVDVTEQCRLEGQVEQLVEHGPDIVIRFDRELRHVYVSPAITESTGFPREHYLGRTNRELGAPDELCTMWERELGAVFATGQPCQFEFALPDADGRTHWYEAHVTPDTVRDGVIESILSYTRDRTDAHRADKSAWAALQASEKRFRSAFDDAAVGMMLVDLGGMLLSVNQAFADMLGYRPEELVGRRFHEITHPEDVARTDDDLSTMRRGGTEQKLIEKRYLSKDGGVV